MDRTIAAIATAPEKSGISIIRISGSRAIEIAASVFRGKESLKDVKSHTINYGFIHNGTEDIDQVLVSVMKAPRSYTGEDVVEINCHGGMTVTRAVLDVVLKAGADMAEAGEFTKRAFLNGKLDLIKLVTDDRLHEQYRRKLYRNGKHLHCRLKIGV